MYIHFLVHNCYKFKINQSLNDISLMYQIMYLKVYMHNFIVKKVVLSLNYFC